jgi:hypothetical protein
MVSSLGLVPVGPGRRHAFGLAMDQRLSRANG